MPKKNWTDEERKAFAEKMKAARNKNLNKETKVEDVKTDIQADPDTNDILRQLKELQESNALLRAAVLNQEKPSFDAPGASLGRSGGVIGVVEKYLVDPDNYPDPTDRLKKEPRLAPLAFEYNYELEYEVAVSNYENKGINYKEPKFMVNLNRIVLDDQGNQTNKRYIARKLIFHEDPQAALVIARDNGIDIDQTDERAFLNEMRYLRVRDWLFDIFWPRPADETSKVTDAVMGGTVVQVFTKSSVDPSDIDFNQIKTKLV